MELEEQELYDPEIYSGTEVRRRIKSDEEWRYLVPKCAKQKIEDLVETVKNQEHSTTSNQAGKERTRTTIPLKNKI